ncbi:hypothetical protein [Methylobacterium sp. PvR107]|uniref:hypothetical protein n=1 Tax=Methylobacterium sp. PvR107 TaxID=2806597 RepID=UPI001B59229F|nr:hypothetical protein [Methylobacterium sp. PvR107]MBP1179053.1 hypothetical protein [Methylobacterium sp. PvR107]
MRLLGGVSAAQPAFGLHDVTRLDCSDDEIVYGLIGRFWRVDFGLERVADGTAFRDCDAPYPAKLALAFAVRPGPEGQTRLITETRVFCASRAARLTFTPSWLLIRPVRGLIRQRMLAAIKRDSERPSIPGQVIAARSS